MAVLVFGGGHSLRVHGSVDETIGLLARSEVAVDGWARIQTGPDMVRVNSRQVAFVADDDFGYRDKAPWGVA